MHINYEQIAGEEWCDAGTTVDSLIEALKKVAAERGGSTAVYLQSQDSGGAYGTEALEPEGVRIVDDGKGNAVLVIG